jgi:glucan endo-1,3-beta-D-glucosidase
LPDSLPHSSTTITMHSSSLLALAASISAAAAQLKGFNYGNTFTTGAAKQQSDFLSEFKTAQGLVGTSGFASARLYTMIQAGTAKTPISAIPAAIESKTSLLLGLWASAGAESFNNEVDALVAAINQYGTAFTDLVVGISVGSEDLYRNSPTGIINKSGYGANPQDLVNYIGQVRRAIQGTAVASKPIGHVDTWTAFVNGSNSAVIDAVDFLGFDGYPYFQNTQANSIDNGKALFYEAYDATIAAAKGKQVWITETGWPVSGPKENLAEATVENARRFWVEVGCQLFGKTNTWWYTLQDALPGTPSPSFGIIPSGSTTPLFDLSCPASGDAPASSSPVASASASASASPAPVPGDAGSDHGSPAPVPPAGSAVPPAGSAAVTTQPAGPAQSAPAGCTVKTVYTTVYVD